MATKMSLDNSPLDEVQVGARTLQDTTSATACSKTVPDVTLSFKDVKYSVVLKKETKPILRGVSGAVSGGQMLCVLGPSGSGKTSLIHVLAKRLENNGTHEISGSLLCNEQETTASQLQQISGLVTQEDVFNGALTVGETLEFMSCLKLPAATRKARVDKVVEMLQLEKCVKTYVGDDSNPYLKGISGGEKRRLAIATEILNPNISCLILDEPTSGLDAAAALNVANILRSLANSGMLVITSLHQPRSSIISKFDQLMVLASGRRIYYGQRCDYVAYLEDDLQCEVPKDESPYDLLLDVLNPAISDSSISMGVISESCMDVQDFLADFYDKSDTQKQMAEELELTRAKKKCQELIDNLYRVGCFVRFLTILRRTFLIKLRDPMVLMTQASSAIMLGTIFGMLYWQVYDRQLEFAMLDTQMCVSMTIMMVIWLPYDVVLTFPKERQIFLRERRAGLYCSFDFFCARILADMPFHIISAALFGTIVYFMAGLECGFHIFLLVVIMAILVGASLMQAIGAVSRTFEEANILMMLVLMMSMMLSTGFVREVPGWMLWMREISVMGLFSDVAMYLEFRDVAPKYGTPLQVFDAYGVRVKNDDDLGLVICILTVLFGVARVITFLAVKFMHTGRSFAENLRD